MPAVARAAGRAFIQRESDAGAALAADLGVQEEVSALPLREGRVVARAGGGGGAADGAGRLGRVGHFFVL